MQCWAASAATLGRSGGAAEMAGWLAGDGVSTGAAAGAAKPCLFAGLCAPTSSLGGRELGVAGRGTADICGGARPALASAVGRGTRRMVPDSRSPAVRATGACASDVTLPRASVTASIARVAAESLRASWINEEFCAVGGRGSGALRAEAAGRGGNSIEAAACGGGGGGGTRPVARPTPLANGAAISGTVGGKLDAGKSSNAEPGGGGGGIGGIPAGVMTLTPTDRNCGNWPWPGGGGALRTGAAPDHCGNSSTGATPDGGPPMGPPAPGGMGGGGTRAPFPVSGTDCVADLATGAGGIAPSGGTAPVGARPGAAASAAPQPRQNRYFPSFSRPQRGQVIIRQSLRGLWYRLRRQRSSPIRRFWRIAALSHRFAAETYSSTPPRQIGAPP